MRDKKITTGAVVLLLLTGLTIFVGIKVSTVRRAQQENSERAIKQREIVILQNDSILSKEDTIISLLKQKK